MSAITGVSRGPCLLSSDATQNYSRQSVDQCTPCAVVVVGPVRGGARRAGDAGAARRARRQRHHHRRARARHQRTRREPRIHRTHRTRRRLRHQQAHPPQRGPAAPGGRLRVARLHLPDRLRAVQHPNLHHPVRPHTETPPSRQDDISHICISDGRANSQFLNMTYRLIILLSGSLVNKKNVRDMFILHTKIVNYTALDSGYR